MLKKECPLFWWFLSSCRKTWNTMYICFFLCTKMWLKIAPISLVEAYVNEKHGEDTSSCGSQFSPCKTLRMGVEQVRTNGTVYINGTQYVNSTINIDKDITIHGLGLKGASIIIPLYVRKLFHIFTVVSQVDATFKFLNIPLMPLQITSSSSITILNSTFIGTRKK